MKNIKYFYEGHLGTIYTTDCKLDEDDLYCEECGDSDCFIGQASKEDAKKMLIDCFTDYEDNELTRFSEEYFDEVIEYAWPKEVKINIKDTKYKMLIQELMDKVKKVNVFDKETMEKLGFYDCTKCENWEDKKDFKPYWLFNKFIDVKDKYTEMSFDIEIVLDKEGKYKDTEYCIIDEDFMQPFNYDRTTRNTQLIKDLEEGTQKWFDYLVEKGVFEI